MNELKEFLETLNPNVSIMLHHGEEGFKVEFYNGTPSHGPSYETIGDAIHEAANRFGQLQAFDAEKLVFQRLDRATVFNSDYRNWRVHWVAEHLIEEDPDVHALGLSVAQVTVLVAKWRDQREKGRQPVGRGPAVPT